MVLHRLTVVAVRILGHLALLEILLEVLQACLDLGRILVGEQRLSAIEARGVQVAPLDELEARVPILRDVPLLNLRSLRLLVCLL